MRRVVGCLILKERKFVMVREAEKSCYGKWNLPLGHLEEGEKIFDGAKREAEEETGLKIELGGLIGVYQHKSSSDGQQVIKFIFEANTKDNKLTFPKEEIPENEIRTLDIKKTMCHRTLKGAVCDRHLFLGCSEKDVAMGNVCRLKHQKSLISECVQKQEVFLTSAVYFSDIKNAINDYFNNGSIKLSVIRYLEKKDDC